LVVDTAGIEEDVAKTEVWAEATGETSVVAVETMLDSKSGRADMFDVEEIESGVSVDIGWLSTDMSSEGCSLVKDDIDRLAADLRRSAANLVRLDARTGEELLISEGKSLSSLDIILAIQCEVFEDNFRVVDLIILLWSDYLIASLTAKFEKEKSTF
jgi:hypothetical protein